MNHRGSADVASVTATSASPIEPAASSPTSVRGARRNGRAGLRLSPTGALCLAAFVVRLLLLARFAISPDFIPNGDDMKFYDDWAQRILAGHWTDGHAFYGLPGYPFALAAIYWLFGPSPIAVGLVQCALEAFTVLCICKIATRVFGEDRAAIGWLAAVGWICFAPAQAFSIILMPTSWVVAAFWGLVWWIVETDERATWRRWLGMGLCIGGIAMFVATILLLLPLIAGAIFFHARGRNTWRPRVFATVFGLVLLLTGVVVGCSPVWLHNYFVARDPVFLSAHSGLNYWIGNNPWATGYPKIPPGLRASQEGLLRDSITVPEQEIGRSVRRSEVSAYWSKKAKAWIEANRAAWWKLLARKFANFWNAFQYDDLSIISLLRTQGIMPPGLRFGPVAALALPALFVALWREPRARWIGGAVALHLAALLPVFVTERYRLCAVPGLLLFASYGLYALRNWIAAHEWKPAIGFAGALAAAAVFVWWPRNDPGLWSLDHYNTGIRALKSENLDLAQRELERAHDLVEDNAEINFALGNLWFARGDHMKVKQFYRRTLELNPRHADCWNNLGVVAIEENAWRAAVGFLENSIHFEPEDAKTQYLLARALSATGETTRARAALAEALKRRPKQPEFLALAAELDATSPLAP